MAALANVRTVDPFSGQLETTLGNVLAGGAPALGDIAIRYDGQMFSLSQGYLGQQSVDANVGNFLQIDTGTAAATNVNDDDIVTYVPDADGNPVRPGPNQQGVGVYFDAIAFRGDQDYDLYAVGRRGDAPNAPVAIDTNILYRFDTQTGIANSIFIDRTGNAVLNGAGTQKVERGQITTLVSEIITVDATDPTNPWDSTVSIQDGSGVTVADLFETHTYEFDTGPEVEVNVDQGTGRVIRDSQFMILDGDFFQFDTGYALVMPEDLPALQPEREWLMVL